MNVYREHASELERFETQMGIERGRLALAQDLLTDALTLVGQHGVYCQSARQPGKPAMDVQIILKLVGDAKELVTDVMDQIKARRHSTGGDSGPAGSEVRETRTASESSL